MSDLTSTNVITTLTPTKILERLHAQVATWNGCGFEAVGDTVLLADGDTEPFDLGSLGFAERLLSLDIPDPWRLCFLGSWTLADLDNTKWASLEAAGRSLGQTDVAKGTLDRCVREPDLTGEVLKILSPGESWPYSAGDSTSTPIA